MTREIAPSELASAIAAQVPGAVKTTTPYGVVIETDRLTEVGLFLRDDPALKLEVLESETAVDLLEQEAIEVVYHLVSYTHNHLAVIKVVTDNRDEPVVPSVIQIWGGAEFQEREIFDLFGVRFAGHPDLRRLFLWDEFRGYPLRKDFLPLSQ